MEPYQETIHTWDKIAALYEERFLHLDLYNSSYDQYCALLPQDAHVLEVGCGPGNITRYLTARRPDLQVLAVDVSPNMIELARHNAPAASYQVMDARHISRLPGRYQGIIAGFCLPYLTPADARQFIADCAGALTAGGALYLSYVAGRPDQSGYQTGSRGDRLYFHYHDPGVLQAALEAAGLAPLSTQLIAYKAGNGTTEQHTVLMAAK